MAPQRHPRFSEEELRVMVEEIIQVEPQLFGAQVQQVSIARKIELWWTIVDRVNAVGQHPRTRDDIRKRWNGLRGKVRSIAARHQLTVVRTGGGPPPPPEQLTTWEEQVLAIMHPVGLDGVAGGLYSGIPANVSGEEVPAISSPPTEEAHSDDNNSGRLDLDDQPGPSGTSGQSVTQAQSQTTTETPPSGNTTTAPTQRTHTSVPRTHQSAVCPPLQGPQGTPHTQDNQGPGVSGSGHTVQGTEAQDNRETERTAVRQGEDRPREPTLQEAFAEILGAYQHSQDMLGQILDSVPENRRLHEGQYQGIREDLQAIYTTLVSIAGVLADMANIMKEAASQQRAPATSQTSEQPSTSAATSGQEAPPQDQQATSTHPPAEVFNCDAVIIQGRPPLPHNGVRLSCVEGQMEVSTYQKKGIWSAIAKDMQTVGVYGRRNTHCRKRWEDLRRWAWKTAEAQLWMASQ
ncbi:hypothetical protein NDU88_008460 [Pleurodeles waltl]|uniref:Myb/SANT-like DNA-binding domain-containing protein n=1 Tax=Pleurodeles waltl TaxID=8319 RepID=A0AAV7RT92_PLEWA|nr:hypothetical protein NDU88_008460 [Pleurodeles waltl]